MVNVDPNNNANSMEEKKLDELIAGLQEHVQALKENHDQMIGELRMHFTEEDRNNYEVGTYRSHSEKKAQNCHCKMHEMYLNIENTDNMHRFFASNEKGKILADFILNKADMD